MPHELMAPELVAYLIDLVPPRDPVMAEMEAYAKETGFPIIGPAAGYFNYLIARLMGARRIFELGSGFGYSTAWFARAVRENGGGEVYHVVWSEELSQKARGYLGRLGLDGVVKFRVGEAVEELKKTEGPFDLMFNDIDKDGYPASIPFVHEKLRPGGAMLIDNMLWHSAIFNDEDRSAATEGVREVTRLLTRSQDWIAQLVPLRDGVILAYRK